MSRKKAESGKEREIGEAARKAGGKVRQEFEPEVPIESLKPNPKNPRRGDLAIIERSVRANGFYGAIVADRATRTIIVGNHRWRAARAAGLQTVPVLWVDLAPDQATRIMVADNRTADLASWDDAGLEELLAELEAAGGLEGTGFEVARRGGEKEPDPDVSGLPASVQLVPAREYVVVMCEDEHDWEWLKSALGLRLVRRGGYRPRSQFDDVGIERVITAGRLREILEGGR